LLTKGRENDDMKNQINSLKNIIETTKTEINHLTQITSMYRNNGDLGLENIQLSEKQNDVILVKQIQELSEQKELKQKSINELTDQLNKANLRIEE